jgi:hypothetical protein
VRQNDVYTTNFQHIYHRKALSCKLLSRSPYFSVTQR